jgi:hypothetical protein
MRDFSPVYELPNLPAVYALYCGASAHDVVYVGVAEKLKQRIIQHFLRRDSSVTTCTTAANLNPDFITRMQWWHHDNFEDRSRLEAAEVIAFELLNPTLRSRGRVNSQAVTLLENDDFHQAMTKLFKSPPSGTLTFPSLTDAFRKIDELERELTEIKQLLMKQPR